MGKILSQEASMRKQALKMYVEAFDNEGLPTPEGWMDQFLAMWFSEVQNPTELPPAPPYGWEAFNARLGGLPWHGAYNHTPRLSGRSLERANTHLE